MSNLSSIYYKYNWDRNCVNNSNDWYNNWICHKQLIKSITSWFAKLLRQFVLVKASKTIKPKDFKHIRNLHCYINSTNVHNCHHMLLKQYVLLFLIKIINIQHLNHKMLNKIWNDLYWHIIHCTYYCFQLKQCHSSWLYKTPTKTQKSWQPCDAYQIKIWRNILYALMQATIIILDSTLYLNLTNSLSTLSLTSQWGLH